MLIHADSLCSLYEGDCREVMAGLPDGCVDAIVTDPPYELGCRGRAWAKSGSALDGAVWGQCVRVLKPGGHLLAFSGTRTQHRMVCAIEDAGFQIRDQIGWLYGSGFPKSLDVGKAIDAAAGAVREVVGQGKKPRPTYTTGNIGGPAEANSYNLTAPATAAAAVWEGWGTALKPAWEPICLARKPFPGTVAGNVLQYGTAGLNIDGCRVETGGEVRKMTGGGEREGSQSIGAFKGQEPYETTKGRFPANVIRDGSPEVLAAFAEYGDGKGACAPASGPTLRAENTSVARGKFNGLPEGTAPAFHGDTGTAARFFYEAVPDAPGSAEEGLAGEFRRFFYTGKASTADRGAGNTHPTVKPMDLMRYLCRLVTPPGGVVLDPFAGSGSTCRAALAEGCRTIGIEMEPAHMAIMLRRLEINFALT